MKKLLFSIFGACMVLLQLQAQPKLPAKCEAGQPRGLRQNIVKDSDMKKFVATGKWGQEKEEKTQNYWIVYSDRSKNTTYNGPSEGSGKFKELSFNERVRIASIENGFALVYNETLQSSIYPAISAKAECRGWVPMKNLLLWQSCPVDQFGVYNKALIVINIEGMSANVKAADLARRYENPATKDAPRKLVASPDFFFVMKTDKATGMVLLAKECKMEGYNYAVLFGWVSPNSYVPWSQRTCLEPNWNPDVVADLGGQRVDVRRGGKKVTDILIGRENKLTNNPSTKYRLEPQLMRYPLLHTTSEYEVTAFARPDGTGHVPTVPVSSGNDVIETENTLLKDASVINLIVVIDGTRSMENYYKPIQEAVNSAYQTFGKEEKTVRVGVVIYRDYADGEFITEKLTMRKPTDPSVAQFLSTGGKYGIKSSPADRTNAEALYKGLEVALDTKAMGYDRVNSNLMFVVGDCGNDEADTRCLSKDAIIKKCIDNKVQLVAFQVRNENDPAFLNFRKQMNKIVKSNLTGQKAFNVDKTKGEKAAMKELVDGFEYRTNRGALKNYYIGAVRNAELGKEMEIVKLNTLIKDCYANFSAALDGRLKVVGDVVDIIGESEGNVDVTNNSMEMGVLDGILTKEMIKEIRKNNSLLAFNGETSVKSPNGQDYWQPIIYISADEFQQLIEKLKPVRTAASRGDRKPYVDALKALIRSQVPDITEAEMDAKDVKEIMALVAGLNVKSGSLGGRTLMQIQDENIVDNVEFQGMITSFNSKFDKLEKINGTKYPFSVERNRMLWYWIPVADLP